MVIVKLLVQGKSLGSDEVQTDYWQYGINWPYISKIYLTDPTNQPEGCIYKQLIGPGPVLQAGLNLGYEVCIFILLKKQLNLFVINWDKKYKYQNVLEHLIVT